MRFEVLTEEDAEKERMAGTPLEKWTGMRWMEKDLKVPCGEYDLHRLVPKPPEKRRVPLADLRALAGAMIVEADGDMLAIEKISDSGAVITLSNGYCYTAVGLLEMHYAIGCEVKPCWTEVDV